MVRTSKVHVQVHHAGQETLALNVDDLGIRRDIHIGTHSLDEVIHYENGTVLNRRSPIAVNDPAVNERCCYHGIYLLAAPYSLFMIFS